MKQGKNILRDLSITVLILVVSFGLVLLLRSFSETDAIAPLIFVLAVLLVALTTKAYLWGVVSAVVSVLAVNVVFTFPYFKFSLTLPENIISTATMLVVAIMTSTLTTKIKLHERLRAESEAERIRANLLRAVSHDLRTPLTTIYGSCSAIIENYDLLKKEQQIKLLGEIREDSEWLIRMVENLLSVTRLDGGKVSIIKTPTVLEELIDTVLTKFAKRYQTQTVTVDIPEEFISIPMDAMLIEQVLLNLLENAVLHARCMTELKLQVSTNGRSAEFWVKDNGKPAEKQLQSADSSKHNMGIGLSVCTAIVKAHGGELQMSVGENGTTIRFSLEMEGEYEQ